MSNPLIVITPRRATRRLEARSNRNVGYTVAGIGLCLFLMLSAYTSFSNPLAAYLTQSAEPLATSRASGCCNGAGALRETRRVRVLIRRLVSARARSNVRAYLQCGEPSSVMCIHPLPAWISGETKKGKPRLVFSSPYETFFAPAYYLPCGKCLGCQVDKRNRWISRMQLEHYCHDNVGTFITLTYRDPAPPRLVKKDVQNFLKRFRNLPRDLHIALPDFKYFFCGEYGSKFGRPHYHGLLFGVDCFNPVFDSVIVDFKNGYPVYSSNVLADTWKHGFITVDKITTSNIRYVSKYILKSHQKHGDEFTLKSIGLGADFFFDFPAQKRSLPSKGCFFDSYVRGVLHFPQKNGKMGMLPIPTKSFDRYVEAVDPALLESLKETRRSYYVKHTPTIEDYRRRSQWLEVMTAEKPNERKLDNET